MTRSGLLRRRFVWDDRGAAMVEFAVATPVLVLLAFGVIDYGRAFYVYNALSSIVRDGARYGAAQGATADATAIKTRVQTVIAREYIRVGMPAPTADQIVVTLTATDVVVTVQNYPYAPWGPVLPMSQDLTLRTSASFRREQ